ncbi:MAG: hypothetical protein WBD20_25825 [Pirellulaceae bacterium]
MRYRSRHCFVAACLMALTVSTSTARAEPAGNATSQSDETTVEFFQAIQDEQVSVQFIPISSQRGNVLIDNKTDAPITLKLPNAFAAVPVLAQLGQQGFGQQAGGGGGSNQAVGGGMDAGGRGQGQNFGGGNNGQIGGFMRIVPDRPRKLKAITVCLEHGKPEPNPRIAYTMMPIEKYTNDDRIAILCSQLARRELSQNVAQAAAWHLANGFEWEKLSKLNRLESKYLGNIRFFAASEIDRATKFVESFEMSQDSNDEAKLTFMSR